MKVYRNYFVAAVVLFVIEVAIALFIDDNFVRPYVGDVLVVMLIYCVVKAFWNTPVFTTAGCVLLFAFGIELLQYFNIIKKLGLQQIKLARTVIGTSSEWFDLISYVAGIAIVLLIEKFRNQFHNKKAFKRES